MYGCVLSTDCMLFLYVYYLLGLSPPDSVAAGLEDLLFPIGERQFGDFGTLAAVSAVTAGRCDAKFQMYCTVCIGTYYNTTTVNNC